MKKLGLFTILLVGILFVTNAHHLPDWGDGNSPASTYLSPYFIEHGMHDTHAPNIVTAVLADYRGFDTMFETAVVFTAGLACFFLLRTPRRKKIGPQYYHHLPTGVTIRIEEGGKVPAEDSRVFRPIDTFWSPNDTIIRTSCRFVIPFIQVYALYVLAHGHYSPGGGFQGGVVLAASLILFAISRNLKRSLSRFSEKAAALLSVIGVSLYAGTATICMLLGFDFLNYKALAPILGVSEVMARSHGILMVETGVALAVMAVMVWIYYNLSSAGHHDEGL